MKTVNEQRVDTKYNMHKDLLNIGKCDKCQVAYLWLKKDGIKLCDASCTCGSKLEKTTFSSTLPLKD